MVEGLDMGGVLMKKYDIFIFDSLRCLAVVDGQKRTNFWY